MDHHELESVGSEVSYFGTVELGQTSSNLQLVSILKDLQIPDRRSKEGVLAI